jgi:hypothetical protein
MTDEELRDFLRSYMDKYKTPTKGMLVDYYRVRFNPDLQFSGDLLEQLGFLKCYHCDVDSPIVA